MVSDDGGTRRKKQRMKILDHDRYLVDFGENRGGEVWVDELRDDQFEVL